jgi:hypothetical protein
MVDRVMLRLLALIEEPVSIEEALHATFNP